MVAMIRAPSNGGDPGWPSGDERPPIGVLTWNDGTPTTSAHVVAWPFFAPRPMIVAKVYMGLTTGQAGAEVMAGIYTNNPVTGRPSSLLQDLGTLDLSATTGKRTWTAGTAAVNGMFWALVWMKNVATQATVRSPTNMAQTFLPIPSTSLVSTTIPSRGLYLAAAYPASMPAAAPAVAAHANATVTLLTVEAA